MGMGEEHLGRIEDEFTRPAVGKARPDLVHLLLRHLRLLRVPSGFLLS
jgi:hypothetical protein